ncbi:MAG: cohesin domain-containing protein, partial [Methanosarcinales archaeon]|nr:cohesin domain-containing protein [Methanosarcinales archaeon]
MISRIICTIGIIWMIVLIPATSAVAYQTNVNVNAPEMVDGNFDVTMEVENVVDLDSGQFDLYFDPSAVNVTGIDDGNIDGTTIPIADWEVSENKIRVLFNLP